MFLDNNYLFFLRISLPLLFFFFGFEAFRFAPTMRSWVGWRGRNGACAEIKWFASVSWDETVNYEIRNTRSCVISTTLRPHSRSIVQTVHRLVACRAHLFRAIQLASVYT